MCTAVVDEGRDMWDAVESVGACGRLGMGNEVE